MRKRLLIIGCCVLGVVIATFVCMRLYPSIGEKMGFETMPPATKAVKPDEVLLQYMRGIAEGDYEGMYSLLGEQSKLSICKVDFAQKNQRIYEGIGASALEISISDISEREDGLTVVSYSCRMDTLAGEISFANQALLSKNNTNT